MAAASLVRSDLEHPGSDSSSVSEEEVQTSWPVRRVGKVVLATGCLVACVAGAAVWGGYSRKTPARMLFESPELADIMSKNLIKEGIVDSGDEAALQEVSRRKLKDVATNLDTEDQAAFKMLDSLMLTKEQKQHIMQKVSSLSDPRLQEFGKEVAKIVLENKGKKPDVVLAALKDKFASKLPELKKLQRELLPNAEGMMKKLDKTRLLEETGRKECVQDEGEGDRCPTTRCMKPASGCSYVKELARNSNGDCCPKLCNVVCEKTEKKTEKEKERRLETGGDPNATGNATGGMITKEGEAKTENILMDIALVLTGLLEQARVIVDQVDFLGESFGADFHISPYVKSAIGALDFVAEVAECMERAGSNEIKMSECPMKFASAGADALECIDNVFGMDNNKFSLNGPAAPTQPVGAAPTEAYGDGPVQPAGAQQAGGLTTDGWTR